MGIASFLMASGVIAFMKFQKSSTLLVASQAFTTKIKGIRNSAINLQLTGVEGIGDCSGLCADQRWMYGIEVAVQNNGFVARRLYRTGVDPVATKFKLYAPLPSTYNPVTRSGLFTNPASNPYVQDANGHELSNYQFDSMITIVGTDSSLGLDANKSCAFVTYISVNGKQILYSRDTSNTTPVNHCMIYIKHQKDQTLVKGLVFDNNNVVTCASKSDCESILAGW